MPKKIIFLLYQFSHIVVNAKNFDVRKCVQICSCHLTALYLMWTRSAVCWCGEIRLTAAGPVRWEPSSAAAAVCVKTRRSHSDLHPWHSSPSSSTGWSSWEPAPERPSNSVLEQTTGCDPQMDSKLQFYRRQTPMLTIRFRRCSEDQVITR